MATPGQTPTSPQVFTREEVAKHTGEAFAKEKKAPFIILHNKVYDVTNWLNDHPGGHEILLQYAGTDATMAFEEQFHSSNARARRTRFFIGDLTPKEHKLCVCRHYSGEVRMIYFDHAVSDEKKKPLKARLEDVRNEAKITAEDWKSYKFEIRSTQEQRLDLSMVPREDQYPLQVKVEPESNASSGQISTKLQLAVAALSVLYIRKAFTSAPIPAVTYSKGLRHAHLLMAIGTFVGIGSVRKAVRSEGAEKRNYMLLHKSSGVLMFLALLVRIKLRLSSAIPAGSRNLLERASYKLLYVILFLLPASGAVFGYFSGTGVPFLGNKSSPSDEDLQFANQAIGVHKTLGRLLEYALVPFHLGMSAFNASNGQDIVRRISPFL